MNFIFRILVLLALSSCQYFQQKIESDRRPVAQANDSFLYSEDLNGLIPNGMSKDDSLILTEKYVDDWVLKQLMISRALVEINYNQAEIDRKVLDYKYSLIVHEFQKLYINSHLSSQIEESEIIAYYEDKSDNFLLKQNIVRCLYAKIPLSTPGITSFRRNVRGYPNSNIDDIKDFCYQYAVNAFTDEEVWINFDELANATPLKEVKNQIQFLESSTFSETSDDDFRYFIKILDYKISDELSPLEFIREDIENILINKRKIELKKELEEAIYDEAKENTSFRIFSR